MVSSSLKRSKGIPVMTLFLLGLSSGKNLPYGFYTYDILRTFGDTTTAAEPGRYYKFLLKAELLGMYSMAF